MNRRRFVLCGVGLLAAGGCMGGKSGTTVSVVPGSADKLELVDWGKSGNSLRLKLKNKSNQKIPDGNSALFVKWYSKDGQPLGTPDRIMNFHLPAGESNSYEVEHAEMDKVGKVEIGIADAPGDLTRRDSLRPEGGTTPRNEISLRATNRFSRNEMAKIVATGRGQRIAIRMACRNCLPGLLFGLVREMQKYNITLIISGVAEITPELADAMYSATKGDIELNHRDGIVFLEFERTAPALRKAVTDAILEVEGANLAVRVVRVESEAANVIAKINADLLGAATG